MDPDSRSFQSTSTRGAVDFDDLAAEKVGPYYSVRLYTPKKDELKNPNTAIDKLSSWLDETLSDIACQSGKSVDKFYIGKTYVRSHKKRKFDKTNQKTWRMGGVSSRWHTHKSSSHGRSGMVVLTVITKEEVPPRTVGAFKHQQQYALALEQRLIAYYAFEKGDERLANETIHPGRMTADEPEASGSIGYPIYVTYTLKDEDGETESQFTTDSTDITEACTPPYSYPEDSEIERLFTTGSTSDNIISGSTDTTQTRTPLYSYPAQAVETAWDSLPCSKSPSPKKARFDDDVIIVHK